jgi:hypothetical protein
MTWWFEVFPIGVIGAPLLVATYRRFPLTHLTYTLLAIHALILMVGGHYTYARVPLGAWAQQLFGLARNDYDRLGHFAQGFVPAILAREILLRTSPLVRGRWLFVLVTALCLAFSALRADRVVDRARRRRIGRGVPGITGRRVGHAVRHVHGVDRRAICRARSCWRARHDREPAALASRSGPATEVAMSLTHLGAVRLAAVRAAVAFSTASARYRAGS